jgi:hypothetical protein
MIVGGEAPAKLADARKPKQRRRHHGKQESIECAGRQGGDCESGCLGVIISFAIGRQKKKKKKKKEREKLEPHTQLRHPPSETVASHSAIAVRSDRNRRAPAGSHWSVAAPESLATAVRARSRRAPRVGALLKKTNKQKKKKHSMHVQATYRPMSVETKP